MKNWIAGALALLAATLASPAPAAAQGASCTPPTNTINCQPAAVSLQLTDLLLGYQNGQTPHTRAPTVAQVLQLIQASYITAALGYTPLSANQTITLSGDAAGSGTTAIPVTISKIGGVSISLAGALATSGANSLTFTTTGPTNVTLPTSGLLLTAPVALSSLATQAANTVLANITAGSAAPTAAALPSCIDSGGNHINYTLATGFSCGTSSSAGGGTVTTVSVASANGFAGSVANPTTTPAITISTSITGALKGNGTAVSQAACADLSNGATGCSTATGTSGATVPLNNGGFTQSGAAVFNGAVSGTGITALFASPPILGGTAPAAVHATNLTATLAPTGTGFTNLFASPPSIGTGTPGIVDGTHLGLSGTTTLAGGSPNPTTSPFYGNVTVNGYNDGANPALNFFQVNDQINGSEKGIYGFQFALTVAAGASGPRVGLFGSASVTATPVATYKAATSGDGWVGISGFGHAGATLNNLYAQGWPSQVQDIGVPSTYTGAVWGGLTNAQADNTPGLLGMIGHEIDLKYDSASTTAEKYGLLISDSSATAHTSVYADVGIAITGVPGFQTQLMFGKPGGEWAGAAHGTVIRVEPRIYAVAANPLPNARYGIDFRHLAVDSDGCSLAMPGFCTATAGDVFGNSLTVESTVQAQTATVTGVTIDDAGDYQQNVPSGQPAIPTFTVSAPTTAGSTATIAVATMVGVAVNSPFGATGSGFLNTDTGLSVDCGGGGVNCTGTPPTFSVTSVDADGGITALAITTNGTLTKFPPSPVALTGGSGTGAFTNIQWDSTAGVWRPSGFIFASTGGGYSVGNTLTVTGDTGTAVQFTVAAVTATGGILPGLTVAAPGSLTAIGAQPHSFTGGAGHGGKLNVGYGVGTFTVTGAGAGYLAQPLPTIRSSLTGFKVAKLRPVMTPAAASLKLQPSGLGVQIGAPTGGDKGAGTMNVASGLYVNGALVGSATAFVQSMAAATAAQYGGL